MLYGQMKHRRELQWGNGVGEGGSAFQISDLVRFGHKKTAVIDDHVQRFDQLIGENRRITQYKIACLVGILKERVNHIIKNKLKFQKICARWVPRMLTEVKKRQHVQKKF